MLGVMDNGSVKHSKVMMWMLKLEFEERNDTFGGKSLRHRSQALQRANAMQSGSIIFSGGHSKRDKVHLTSIQVVQSSNASNTKAWNEEDQELLSGNAEEVEYATTSHRDEEQDKDESFLATLPKQWKLEDLIIDKDKHKCEFRYIEWVEIVCVCVWGGGGKSSRNSRNATAFEEQHEVLMDMMYSSARSSLEEGSWTFMTDTLKANDGASLRVYSRAVDW